MTKEVLILVDADVLIHLFKADRITLLDLLFPKRVRMLDIVLNELRNNLSIREKLDSIFIFSGIKEIQLPTTTNPKLFQEFLKLKRQNKGAGECATLVYCKYNKHVIASSNTSDILPYCTDHDISYLTTLDIFAIALKKGEISEEDVTNSIGKITLNNESHLCCRNIDEHLHKHFDPLKYLY